MTTSPPKIHVNQLTQESEVLKVPARPRGSTPDDLPDQYIMARRQYLSFTQKEADDINQTLDLIKRVTKKSVSPNKLIKQAALQKAQQVLNQGEK